MDAFENFSETVCSGGGRVFFSDHPNNLKLLRRLGKSCSKAVVYGLGGDCTLRGQDVREEFGKSSFSVMSGGKRLGEIELCLPGKYNVYNALAAIAVAGAIGVEFNVVREVLSGYRGADRRFQARGEANGVLVVEDYGHHPTEIRAALRAAKKSGRRIVAVFQPHRYSRTAKLAVNLGKAFGDADVLVVTDIYGAGESPIPNVSSEQIVRAAEANGHSCACYVPDMWDVVGCIGKNVKSGDLLLILGAGNINEVIEPILKSLRCDV
jgi:UDP-N-acetylmuramate--alanine ligase